MQDTDVFHAGTEVSVLASIPDLQQPAAMAGVIPRKQQRKAKALAAAAQARASAEAGLPFPSNSSAASSSSGASPKSAISASTSHPAMAGTDQIEQQQQQQPHVQLVPQSSFPKVSISSHKRIASPASATSGPRSTSRSAAPMTQQVATSDAGGAVSTAHKRLKTSLDGSATQMPSSATSASSIGITNDSSSWHALASPSDQHLSLQLADAPGPAIATHSTATKGSVSSSAALAPTPASSPAKSSLPRPTSADLANLTQAASILSKNSGLSAEASSFEPQSKPGQMSLSPVLLVTQHASPWGSGRTPSSQQSVYASGQIRPMAQGFVLSRDAELPQRQMRPNDSRRRQSKQRRDTGPSRLSKTTFTDLAGSQDADRPSIVDQYQTDQLSQQPTSAQSTDQAARSDLSPPWHPQKTSTTLADPHGNPAPNVASGLPEIQAHHADPASLPTGNVKDEGLSAPPVQHRDLAEDLRSPKSVYSASNSFSADPIDNMPPGLVAYPYVQPLASVLPGVTDAPYALNLISSAPGAHQWPVRLL